MENMKITDPYTIKKMGTSGLRMTQEDYNREGFLEQFVQGIALYFLEISETDSVATRKKTILLGGDPRKGNAARIDTAASILTGNGFDVIIAHNGLASTPAMSYAIKKLGILGGIIFTASHNPFTDVGIKVNISTGAPALSDAIDRIHELQNATRKIVQKSVDEQERENMISYVDIVSLYGDLLDSIFDFTEMRKKISELNITGLFDAMNGAAGPFARDIFINRLSMNADIMREKPREDLGGYGADGNPIHPEPDFEYVPGLIQENSTKAYHIVAAWDSDVDRRLDGGSGFFVESADEFALFSRYSHLIDIESLFEDTIYFCRSTVTADPVDRMKEELQNKYHSKTVKTVETPTGFKWIAELGNWGVEESNGVGNPCLREKDGIFATVFLLKIILETGKTPQQLMEELWSEYGRVYFTRGEVSGSEDAEKHKIEEILQGAPSKAGRTFGTLRLESAKQWDYIHPRSGKTVEKNAAYVLNFNDGNTVKARFSGTGSGGYTLRVYCSKYDKKFNIPKSAMMQPMKDAFDALLHDGGCTKKSEAYSDTKQPEIYA